MRITDKSMILAEFMDLLNKDEGEAVVFDKHKWKRIKTCFELYSESKIEDDKVLIEFDFKRRRQSTKNKLSIANEGI